MKHHLQLWKGLKDQAMSYSIPLRVRSLDSFGPSIRSDLQILVQQWIRIGSDLHPPETSSVADGMTWQDARH